MQKFSLSDLTNLPKQAQELTERSFSAPIVLADPFDLTKMLDIPPGLYEMQGTAALLKMFYLNF